MEDMTLQEVREAERAPARAETTAGGSGLKVLIVEDECIIAMDMSRIVSDLGYSVSGVVDTGEDSIREAGKIRPDVVLMDIMIKGRIDGLRAARAIRTLFQIPIVYTTAYSDLSTMKRAQATNPAGFLLKPFTERELGFVLSEIRRVKRSA